LKRWRAARSSVDQRRGRAGRTAPGVCYRLWDEPQTAALPAFAPPEVLAADLSGLVLDLAQWGVGDPAQLAFLDPPPQPALVEARALLTELGALDGDGRITGEGRRLRRLALPPRLARMIVAAAREGAAGKAALIAAVLTERGLGGDSVDCEARLDVLRRDRGPRAMAARQAAQRWAAQAGVPSPSPLVGEGRWGGPRKREGGWTCPPDAALSLAFPDRIAKNRGDGSFLLANAVVPASTRLAPGARAISCGCRTGGPRRARRILLAAGITAAGDRDPLRRSHHERRRDQF